MPVRPMNRITGTRQLASRAGNSSRIVSTYPGIRPAKPKPKMAETVNSPYSFCVVRNRLIARAWQTDVASTVRSPPIRSASQPQNCRLKKAQASSSDSIAGPCEAVKPRSLQNATRCCSGMDMVTQQKKVAVARMPSAKFGFSPNTGRPPAGPEPAAPAIAYSGGRRRNTSANGRTVQTTKSP